MFTILGTDGKEYGPVSTAKIQEWMLAGRANLETKIRRAGDTEWRTLGEFPELTGTAFAAPATPLAAPPTFIAPVPADFAGGLPLANRWVRLGAILLDTVIGFTVTLPGLIVLGLSGTFTTPDNPNVPLFLAGMGLCAITALALIAVQIYLLVTRGQTIGKKILGIKIVTFDTEENPGFVKVFLLRVVVNAIIGFVPLYGLVDAIFIFREDHRCVHDLLAGTKVVKA